MQRSRARLTCLILALVVSGCMRTTAPVAVIDNGSLDAIAYGPVQPVRAVSVATTPDSPGDGALDEPIASMPATGCALLSMARKALPTPTRWMRAVRSPCR